MGDTDNFIARGPSYPAGSAAASVKWELQRLFYMQQVPKLLASLMHQGAQKADAEEIVWSTMAKVWRYWGRIDNPEAWVKTVARRELSNRRLAKKDEELTADVAALATGTTCDTDDWVQNNELHRILALLPPRQRQVLALYVQRYTPTEIAATLDITPAAARASLKKAKKNVAIHLDGRSEKP